MEDIPWVPIAMVFIAFLSWLRTRIQEASEIRRARNAAKAEAARARRTTVPAEQTYESPYRETQAREIVEEIPKTFRELFDEINAQEEIPPPPMPSPRSNYTPPPLPKAAPEPESEITTWDVEVDSTQMAKASEAESKPRAKKAQHPFIKILSNGDQLRNALILKEVLSPPKALKNRGRL